MGTPLSNCDSPLQQRVFCSYCNDDFNVKQTCHNLCQKCQQVPYCPLCLTPNQENPEVFENQKIILQPNATLSLTFQKFTLEIITIGGYLFLLQTKSTCNLRVQYHWQDTISDLVLFRDRLQTHYPSMLQKKPANIFYIQVVPINLKAPRFNNATACAWRFYIEMYPWSLDRPESRSLALLPDNSNQMLQQITSVPCRDRQLYSFPLSHFAKFDRYFFAATTLGFECIQCYKTYLSKEELLKNCMPLQATFIEARPIDTNGFFCGPNGSLQIIKRPTRPQFSSLFVKLDFFKSIDPLQTIDQILNPQGKRIPWFIIYNSDLTSAHVWLCRVISNFLPPELTILHEIGHFETQLHMSLHKTIVTHGSRHSCGFLWRGILAI
jgi:hypothetical protein